MNITIEEVKESVQAIWLKKTVKSILITSTLIVLCIIAVFVFLAIFLNNPLYLFAILICIFEVPYFFAGFYNLKKYKYLIKNYEEMTHYEVKLDKPEKAYRYRGKCCFFFEIRHKGEKLKLDTPAMWSIKKETGLENSRVLMLYDDFYKEAFLVKKI